MIDALERVTGRVAYTINAEAPGMLHARLLRSRAAHATDDQGTSSSRSTYAMGAAVMAAAQDLRQQLLRHAADLLEAAPGDIEIVNGQVRIRGAPDRALDYAAIVRRGRLGNVLGNGEYRSEGGLDAQTGQGIGSVHWHQAAGAAEVEVDLETGKVNVLRYHAAAPSTGRQGCALPICRSRPRRSCGACEPNRLPDNQTLQPCTEPAGCGATPSADCASGWPARLRRCKDLKAPAMPLGR
jgi:CO/xanthine dehydrogenase Mo-binding subunit